MHLQLAQRPVRPVARWSGTVAGLDEIVGMNGDCLKPSTAEPKPKRETKKIDVGLTLNGKLKELGGSMSQGWNDHVVDQAMSTFCTAERNRDIAVKKSQAAGEAMLGIAPKNEMEGMFAAQIVACHNAAMECYRRAIENQTFKAGRKI